MNILAVSAAWATLCSNFIEFLGKLLIEGTLL